MVVTIAVENAGGHDARFRANLGSTVLSGLEPIDFVVPAGETTVERLPVNTFTPDEDETIRLDWGVDSKTVTVPAR